MLSRALRQRLSEFYAADVELLRALEGVPRPPWEGYALGVAPDAATSDTRGGEPMAMRNPVLWLAGPLAVFLVRCTHEALASPNSVRDTSATWTARSTVADAHRSTKLGGSSLAEEAAAQGAVREPSGPP